MEHTGFCTLNSISFENLCLTHLRRLIGKRLLVKFGARIQKVMLGFLHFGVAVPGGAEVLIHARRTAEEVAFRGGLGVVAVVDIDLINCFGMFEWPATLDAMGEP